MTISTLVTLTEGEDYLLPDTGEIIFSAVGLQRSLDAIAAGKEPVIYQDETLIWTARE